MAQKEAYFEKGGFSVYVEQETHLLDSPRDWDNLGTVIGYHSRYHFGDVLFTSGEDVLQHLEEIKAEDPKTIILPVYLYDHSGTWLSTGREWPFNCPWDSGQIGFIYATREDIRKWYNVKHVREGTRDKARLSLIGEIENYSKYFSGDVWHAWIEDTHENVVDSCGGLYGTEGIQSFIDDQLDYYIEEEKKNPRAWLVFVQLPSNAVFYATDSGLSEYIGAAKFYTQAEAEARAGECGGRPVRLHTRDLDLIHEYRFELGGIAE